MNKTTSKKYARAIVKIGANVKRGQRVVIRCSTSCADFVKYVVEECYKAHARSVEVEWNNQEITKLALNYESVETLSEFPLWKEEKMKYGNATLPAMIYIDDSAPDAMEGVDNQKFMTVMMNRYQATKKYEDEIDNKCQWVMAAYPSISWAKKVFPNDRAGTAYKKLEKAILECARIDNGNPIKVWKQHIRDLKAKCALLNEYNFKSLHYTSKNGTDLDIELQENHVWLSARETTLLKREFTANMPSEECFTMPKKDGVNGVVVSTKPLSFRGQLIEDFKITFENGKAVKVQARVGQELLESMISTDEGSAYLGEVALVPFDSPINRCGILFYKTLFDENASCHLALGESFKNNIKNYEKLSKEDWERVNLNESSIHTDFMVGSEDLNIVGTTHDGRQIEVFKNGNWAI